MFGYNEEDMDRAVEIAKEEDFSLLLVNTNRGFNPGNPLLRDNVDFTLTKPSESNLQERVKKEIWAHKSQRLLDWHRRGVRD